MSDYVEDDEYQQEAEKAVAPVAGRSTDPNEILKYTQGLRYRVVDQLTDNGAKIPDDPTMLLQVMRDMDTSALTTRKLNIEEKSANDGRKAIETMRQLRQLLGTSTPLAVDGGGTIDVKAQRIDTPTSGVVLPDVAFIPGEDFQGEQPLNIGDYVAVD